MLLLRALSLFFTACTVEPSPKEVVSIDDAIETAFADAGPAKLTACPMPALPRTATYEADGVTYTIYMRTDAERCGEDGILVTWTGSDESTDEGCMNYDGIEQYGDVRVRAFRGWALGVVWYMCGSLLIIAPDYSDPEVAEDPDEHWDPIFVPTKIID